MHAALLNSTNKNYLKFFFLDFDFLQKEVEVDRGGSEQYSKYKLGFATSKYEVMIHLSLYLPLRLSNLFEQMRDIHAAMQSQLFREDEEEKFRLSPESRSIFKRREEQQKLTVTPRNLILDALKVDALNVSPPPPPPHPPLPSQPPPDLSGSIYGGTKQDAGGSRWAGY